MTLASFFDLTHDEALRFRDHVQARHAARLSDLAWSLADTDGPVDELDGSEQSLVPLWAWFKGFVKRGLPGVAPQAQSSMSRRLGRAATENDRIYFAAEMLEHYAFEVVRRTHPDVRWGVYRQVGRGRDLDQNLTGFEFPDGVVTPIGWRFATITLQFLDGDEVASTDEALRNLVRRVYRVPASGSAHAPGPSLLAPLLAAPRVSDDDPSRLVPDVDS